MIVYCNYCLQPAKLVTGDYLYPHIHFFNDKIPAHSVYFWHCKPCDAWVGTHKNSKKNPPLGSLANKELRIARRNAHAVFDTLFKDKAMTRTEAYRWLSEALGLPVDDCHIALFTIEQCEKTVDAVTIKNIDDEVTG